MGAPELVIDSELKLWVVIPIFAVMVLIGVGRHYAMILFQATPPLPPINELKEQGYLQYGATLRRNAFNLTQDEYARRMRPLVANFREGSYLANPSQPPPSAMPSFTDPQSSQVLISGIRNQVLTYIPQTLTMQWISAFFGNFIVMKLPFPLTTKFKSMFQSNVNTNDLDVRWVSSISLYLLLFIGLDGIFKLTFGSGYQSQAAQGSNTPGIMAPNVDKRKLFESEADALEIEKQPYVLDGVRKRVLKLNFS